MTGAANVLSPWRGFSGLNPSPVAVHNKAERGARPYRLVVYSPQASPKAHRMQSTRPVFLDLRRIKLPITGIVSILHRISGVLMVLTIPLAAILFNRALASPEGFATVVALLDNWLVRLLLLVLTWSLLHHLLAGIRYLLLDLGFGLERPAARQSARGVLVAAAALLLVLIILGALL